MAFLASLFWSGIMMQNGSCEKRGRLEERKIGLDHLQAEC